MRLENGEVLLLWPLALHVLTAGYYYNSGGLHRAIDLRAAVGTPVYAAEDGTVDWVQTWDGHSTSGDQSYGNLVRIRHADYNGGKLQTLYAHLKESKVKYGQAVKEGELIGYTGQTGAKMDPIDAVAGMSYVKDKYYRDPVNGEVYICTVDVAYAGLPHEAVNVYFNWARKE